MNERQASPGQPVTVGQNTYTVTYDKGQVRVHLPFAVDPHALSHLLLREGFPLAHEPDTTDTQGWGHDFESNGYYPYWVYPDPERPRDYVFAFNPQPEDVVDHMGDETVALGKRSADLVDRWVPVLEQVRQAH